MKTYARVQDGKVVEIIEPMADDKGQEIAIEKRFYPDFVATCVDATGVEGVADGWTLEAGVFLPPLPPALVVPQVVTMRQARLALLAAQKLADVDAAIEAMSEPDRSAAKIEWEYSQEVHRTRPFVLQLGAALGLDDAALDALFVQAATL